VTFLDQDWICIFIFEKNWIRTGSGYLFDFYNAISLIRKKEKDQIRKEIFEASRP